MILSESPNEPVKLLLVDDRPENLLVLEEVLANLPCELLKTLSGQEALSKLLKHDVALVILDVQLPDMSGFEVAEFMRGKKRSQHVPIIFVTASDKEPLHVFKGYEAGAVDYLFKPLDPMILRSKVRVFIDLYRQKQLLQYQSRELELRMAELESEVTRRQEVEQELRRYQNQLEELVSARTEEIITVNERLRDEIVKHERVEQELRQVMEGVIQAMALTAEIRDPYTAGHQRRVSKLATAIAREMGLSEHEIEGIRLAALVHDLGKIYVPAEILSKPGHLNEIEFGLIKSHPQLGYDILHTIDFPWPIANIVLQHQERLNGTGYPAGLRHDEIMLEARIISVADVVEAMAFHRPYRPALGMEKAIEEIMRQKGHDYDADVVEACLKILRQNHFTFDAESEASGESRR